MNHKRHRHYHQRRHKSGEFAKFIFYSAISAVVFLLIYSVLFDESFATNIFQEAKEIVSDGAFKLSNEASKTTSIASKCRSQYNEFASIGEQKYNINYDLIKIQQLNNKAEVEDFNNLYSAGFFGGIIETSKINVYPIVGIAASASSEETTLPVIVNCDHNGDLTEFSQDTLTLTVRLN